MIPPGGPSRAGASTVDRQLTIQERFTLDARDAYLTFSPDDRVLVTGIRGANPDTSGEVKLWDVETGEQRGLLLGHFNGIGAVAFSPDGTRLAAGLVGVNARSGKCSPTSEVTSSL